MSAIASIADMPRASSHVGEVPFSDQSWPGSKIRGDHPPVGEGLSAQLLLGHGAPQLRTMQSLYARPQAFEFVLPGHA